MEVKVTDNSEIFKNAMKDGIAAALDAMGKTAERYAKEQCPTDTGRLKNSITYATEQYSGQGSYSDDNGKGYSDATAKVTPEKNAVYVGSNVEYALVQETGNFRHNSGAAHFMRDSVANHGDEYKRIAVTNIKNHMP